DVMATTKLATFDAPKPAPTVAPAAPKKPAEPEKPLVSDDLMAGLANIKPTAAAPAAPAFDPNSTQKLPPGADRTSKMTTEDMERTQKVTALDPNYRPDSTQKLDPQSTQKLDPQTTQKLDPQSTQKLDGAALAPSSDPETTQRVDDSIWRLEEAKRILSNIPQK